MDRQETLNLDRFAKLWRVAASRPHESDNAPERESARRMAEALARRHGMSLDDAVAAIGGTQSRFPLDPLEQAIRDAGIDPHEMDLAETLPLYQIVMRAIPFPDSIRAAVAEFERWDKIEAERAKAVPSYKLGKAAAMRRSMTATVISDYKASSIAEATARARWVESQLWRPGRFGFQEKRAVQTMAADMARMAERVAVLTRGQSHRRPEPEPQPAPLRRTNAQKRAAVVSILDGPGGDRLTLRQVAELAGVSPETVRAVKRSRM